MPIGGRPYARLPHGGEVRPDVPTLQTRKRSHLDDAALWTSHTLQEEKPSPSTNR